MRSILPAPWLVAAVLGCSHAATAPAPAAGLGPPPLAAAGPVQPVAGPAAPATPAGPPPVAVASPGPLDLPGSWERARRAAAAVLRAPAPLLLVGQRVGPGFAWTWSVAGAGGQVAEVAVAGQGARVVSVGRRENVRAADVLELSLIRVGPAEALAAAGARRVESLQLAPGPRGGARWSLTLAGGERLDLDATAEVQ